MGIYDVIVKIEEMRRHMEEGDTASAQKILDTVEIKKIKNMSDLNLVAGVYADNERYEEAVQLYLKIYQKTKSRKSLFQLVDLYIKLQKQEEAELYLKEYEKQASKDFYKYIFRYKIDKLKGASYATLIDTLETLKTSEYMEKWAYELAKTYYKAGMEKECIRECSDIILWFGDGIYVEKAKLLRSYYSGETNKEMIMEELKRRAMEDNESSMSADPIKGETIHRDELQIPSENNPEEEEVYSSADFSIAEEAVEFENDLKKDIMNILSEATEDNGSMIEAQHTEEEYMDEEATAEFIEAEDTLEENNFNNETEEGMNLPIQRDVSERDLAEQEVEKAIYQMLDEEDMDEDDKKLKQITEELQFDTEEVFDNFLHVKAVKKQLVKSLEGILDVHTKTVHILITGTAGSGKTTLAKDITMFLYKSGKLKSSKIAKIKADKLNSIDIMTKKDTLKDCCLVVENASELKRETIDSLLEMCRILRGNIAVIFEENKKNINKLFRECPKLMDLFKNRIHLPGYTTEDLIGFAYACLKLKDYRLIAKAEPILIQKINQIAKQSESHLHLEQIYGLMQAAMDAADLRTGKQLSNLASQGRLRDVEILTVLPEDFIIRP